MYFLFILIQFCLCTLHAYCIHSILEKMPFFHLPNQPNQPTPTPPRWEHHHVRPLSTTQFLRSRCECFPGGRWSKFCGRSLLGQVTITSGDPWESVSRPVGRSCGILLFDGEFYTSPGLANKNPMIFQWVIYASFLVRAWLKATKKTK